MSLHSLCRCQTIVAVGLQLVSRWTSRHLLVSNPSLHYVDDRLSAAQRQVLSRLPYRRRCCHLEYGSHINHIYVDTQRRLGYMVDGLL